MPIDKSSSRPTETQLSKSSKLKEQHDSGYSSRSSRGTPELSPSESPQLRSTRYKVRQESDSESEDEITIVPEPDGGYQRVRETTPRSRRPPTTPHSASSIRMPPFRSGSYVKPADEPPTPRTAPPFIRTESGRPPPMQSRPSARGSPRLFREVSPTADDYKVVNQSPRYRPDDVKYASYSSRRGSDDLDREVYPGSPRPGISRSDSRAVHA